jgi:hypothetical protein
MARTIRLAIAAAVLAALALGTVSSAAAGGRKVFSSSMVGISTPNQVLFGVTGGGIAWDIDEGSATLTADGRLHVEVQGLVLATAHINPIPTGRAILACGGVIEASTDPVTFSMSGDAEVDATVSLTGPCLAPAVFFAGVTTGGDRWFAVTGF